MFPEDKDYLQSAKALLDEFASRTGLIGESGDPERRYLWTDAFAVQASLGLSHVFGHEKYKKTALKLIDTVHNKLGRFHKDDERKGWISGLGEREGQKHPTSGGLRIGKKLPERKENEPFNERLEWERDGQYFHYLTRWINALLTAGDETGEEKYKKWASELVLAGRKFIVKNSGRTSMYWKISLDLSRALVPSMGAHDPLEGLIYAKTAMHINPNRTSELSAMIRDLELLCAGRNWATSDPLGIGGLLLDVGHVADLVSSGLTLPKDVQPEKLFAESLTGLEEFAQTSDLNMPAFHRLPFRECGLSLGINVILGRKEQLSFLTPQLQKLGRFLTVAEEIEHFWKNSKNQTSSTWQNHLDINNVTLAASLIAKKYPYVF